MVDDIQFLNFFAQMITGSKERAYEEENTKKLPYTKSFAY